MASIHRFFFPGEIDGSTARLEGTEVHHMVKVLRKGKGSKVILFDGAGYEYLARVDAVSKEAVEVTILSKSRVNREPHVAATLCVAVPKGERMEQLIRGCSELGARRIVPLLARRSVVKGGQSGSAKLERWRRVAVEASKQSGRVSVCEVAPSTSLGAALEEIAGSDLALYGSPDDGNPFVAERLSGVSGVESVVLFVGPEGGFTRKERATLEQAGAAGVGIGRTILRVETAAVAMLAMVLYGTREPR